MLIEGSGIDSRVKTLRIITEIIADIMHVNRTINNPVTIVAIQMLSVIELIQLKNISNGLIMTKAFLVH